MCRSSRGVCGVSNEDDHDSNFLSSIVTIEFLLYIYIYEKKNVQKFNVDLKVIMENFF